MKTQKRHLIILMMFVIGLLQTNTILRAQERATTVNWSGEVPGQTISTNTDVYLIGNVMLKGTITVSKGAALNIYAKDANRTITRGSFNGHMFYTEVGEGVGQGKKEGGILRFNADNRTQTITIDGGAIFEDNDAKKGLTNSPHTGRVIMSRGRLRMHHVIIQNINDPNENGGAISFDSQGSMPNGDGYYTVVNDVIIRAVKAGTVILFNGDDHHNFADNDFKRVEIYNCSSLGLTGDPHGGTIRAVGGVKSNLVLNECKIHDNEAAYGGAAAWNAGNGTSCKLRIIGNTKIYNNVATENGGGISSLSTVELQSAEIYNNRAKKKGGGLCVDTYWGGMTTYSGGGFEVEIVDGVSIHDNTADEAGGGIYLLFQASDDVGFDVNNNPISPQFKFEMTGGSIYNNHAPIGAGVAIDDMAPNRHKNRIFGTWSGDYVRNVSISKGNIYGNSPVSGSTDTKGAGIYIAKAKAADIADSSIGYTYGTAITGGGVVTAGTLTIKPTGGNIYENLANNGSGGGMYIVDEMNNVSPYYSVCKVNVGAVNIYGNTCTNNGGGLYVESGIISLSGANVSGNSTNSGNGGGIYFDANSTMTVGTGNLKVKDNTANGVPNNIYLPTGKTIGIVSDDFNPIYVGIYTQNRTPNIPVFTGTKEQLEDIYGRMVTVPATRNVVDDSQCFSPYLPSPMTTLYFGDSPWSPLQQTVRKASDLVDSNNDEVFEIGNVKQLTAFLWYVNGITKHDATFTPAQPRAKAILTADIDMTNHYWTPFANYTGTFDGNGHTITGITMVPTNASTGRGLFGTTGEGADIKNVALDDCHFFAKASGDCYVGSVVSDLAAGTVSNSVANPGVNLTASGNASAVLGGIAGRVSGGTLHSSIAMAEMTGYQMGGLVGANSGDLYNSYAYSKFDHKGGSTYFGGLVGVNTGRVENCYSRVQGTAPTSTYFGWLAGNNTSASDKGLYYSYSPNATYVATASGTTSGNQTGLSTFGVTVANAYDYRVRDNQVAATNAYAPTNDAHHLADYQLKKYLNKWVDTKNGSSSTYAGWTRPTTQAINDDYPLLKLSGFNAVAATNGEICLDYGDINSLLTSHATENNTILFYGSKAGVNSNSGSAAPLYIDEDAVLTQNGTIQAYVGVTLDNSACHNGANPTFGGGTVDYTDWHFFSSSLSDAPIGLEYPSGQTSYGEEPEHATFTGDYAANGYFPTNLDSYYTEWDLYSYSEPEYHWINLKRNSDSHWHEDFDHGHITYLNPTVFNPGQGFLVATAEESYLQAYGTLNTNTGSGSDFIEVPLSYTSDVEWTTREGQNLLGNPYQSYLDFDAFADDDNNKTLWPSSTRPFYIIMDEDKADYVTYTKGQTPNEARAGRYLHPHQGFMIKVGSSGTAYFDNTMRSVTMDEGWSSSFRGGDRPNYPLVNLFAKDGNGNRDMVTVELGRPDKGGLLKSHVPGTSTGRLYCRYEEKDYDLAFTEPGLAEAAIRFTTKEDGEYTMTWNTQNGDFSYLHLIDNLTGTDIDCLTTDEYKFSALTSDYESRFRLVFDYTGIEENGEDGASASTNFAFMMGDQLVVNGEGTLQLFDVTGRLLLTTEVNGVQTTMPKPNTGTGIYLLRLTGVNGSKTQKIVIP